VSYYDDSHNMTQKSLGGGKDGSIFISASYFAANRFAELFC